MNNNSKSILDDCSIYKCFVCCKMFVELACFICICILCGLSKKNPLEIHTIGNLTDYFNDVDNTTSNNAYNTNKNIINITDLNMTDISKNDDHKSNINEKTYNLNEDKNNSSDDDDIEKIIPLRKFNLNLFVMKCVMILKNIKVRNFRAFLNLIIKKYVILVSLILLSQVFFYLFI